MKIAPLSYLRPRLIEEACEALASDEDARIIAGGQTLIPMLAMRLSRPSLLVDVSRIEEMIGVEVVGDRVVVGAATRQAAALGCEGLARDVPLLAKALPHVGHPPTRCRGTIGGSIAHGDPSAEISLVAAVLDARIVFRDGGEDVTFAPEDFFIGPTVTSAPPAGCLVRVTFPKRPDGRVGTGFCEIASRRSDYAFASAAAQVVLDDDGSCLEVRLGVGSVGDVPERRDIDALCGSQLSDGEIEEAVGTALADLETVDDLHASASYRRRAAARLAGMALREARDDAGGLHG